MSYGPKSIRYEQTSDRQINDLQQSLTEAMRNLQMLTPLTGAYITTIANAAGISVPIVFAQNNVVRVVHNLGYAYTGFIIANVQYSSGSFVSPLIVVSTGNENAQTQVSSIALINLSPVTVTAHVWVY